MILSSVTAIAGGIPGLLGEDFAMVSAFLCLLHTEWLWRSDRTSSTCLQVPASEWQLSVAMNMKAISCHTDFHTSSIPSSIISTSFLD
jgi:hypothetical protein